MPVIEKMVERLTFYTIEDESLRHAMHDTISKLKDKETYRRLLHEDLFKNDILKLAHEIPDNKYYGHKEMAPYRERIDNIVRKLIQKDPEMRKYDENFKKSLVEHKREMEKYMGTYYKMQLKKEECEKDKENVNVKDIHCIETLEWDYKRQLGNILIGRLREIKKADFKGEKGKNYFLNDKRLKAKIDISRRKVKSLLGGLMSSFAKAVEMEVPIYRNRLQEIEEEMKAEKAKEECEAILEEIASAQQKKYNRYAYGKDD